MSPPIHYWTLQPKWPCIGLVRSRRGSRFTPPVHEAMVVPSHRRHPSVSCPAALVAGLCNRLAFDTAHFGRVGILICEDYGTFPLPLSCRPRKSTCSFAPRTRPGVVSMDRGSARQKPMKTSRRPTRIYGCGGDRRQPRRVRRWTLLLGGSSVTGPDGQTIAQAPQLDESLTLATFDAANVRRQRLITPLARDERLLLTIEELNRIKRNRYGC